MAAAPRFTPTAGVTRAGSGLTVGDLLAKFAQSPSLTWSQAKSAFGLGRYSEAQIQTALSSAGVSTATISSFLTGKATTGSVVDGVTKGQSPAWWEALLTGVGLVGAGVGDAGEATGAGDGAEATGAGDAATGAGNAAKDSEEDDENANNAAKDESGSGGSSGANQLSKLISEGGTAGAIALIFDDLKSDAKYAAVWIGLFALALTLIIKGFSGGKDEGATKIIPVPA